MSRRADFLEYNMSVYCMNTQAKDLPDLHRPMFRCCSDMQEVTTLQPPATDLMPTRWNALFLKFARGNRDFCYYSTKGGGGGLKRRGEGRDGSTGGSTLLSVFLLSCMQHQDTAHCSCSPNPDTRLLQIQAFGRI